MIISMKCCMVYNMVFVTKITHIVFLFKETLMSKLKYIYQRHPIFLDKKTSSAYYKIYLLIFVVS